MKKNRLIAGVICVGVGVLVTGLSLLGGFNMMIRLSIYSVPAIVVGTIILINKGADKIDQIDYSKIKRRK